jgi:hypothetical protein
MRVGSLSKLGNPTDLFDPKARLKITRLVDLPVAMFE